MVYCSKCIYAYPFDLHICRKGIGKMGKSLKGKELGSGICQRKMVHITLALLIDSEKDNLYMLRHTMRLKRS